MRPRPATAAAAAAAAAALLIGGCSGPGGGPAPSPSTASPSAPASSSPGGTPPPPARGTAKVTGTVTEGLDSPWGVALLPGGDALVASRDTGTVHRVDAESGRKTEAGRVPGVAARGEGGLLGLALSPDFGSDSYVYAYVTTGSDNRIVRMAYDDRRDPGQQLGAPDVVLRGIPKGEIHNGGRIAFGPDGMLYAGTGETGRPGLAQDEDSLGGKILRMTPEGEPAGGNPDAGSVVYSLGHRNVQGLAWDGEGRLWASELGQNTWDELNLVRAGGNYGWPEVEGDGDRAGYVDPVVVWRPADASPSGIAIARGSVWVASLRGERLWRVPLDGTRAAAEPQAFLTGEYGRLRTVVAAPDGSLWLTTSNTDGRGDVRDGDDRLLRLTVR